MTLYFEDKNSKAKKIFEANENLSNEDQSKECYDEILRRCADMGYKVYYLRSWETVFQEKEAIKVDFGSHNEFFYVVR